MVMTRPPAYHFCKFLMKNMIPTNSGLKYNNFSYCLWRYYELRILECIVGIGIYTLKVTNTG